jgi:hypothetical protein
MAESPIPSVGKPAQQEVISIEVADSAHKVMPAYNTLGP